MHGLRSLAFKATEVEVGIFGTIWGSEIEGTEKERERMRFFLLPLLHLLGGKNIGCVWRLGCDCSLLFVIKSNWFVRE